MSAKSAVPIFYWDQDDSDSPCRIVPRDEARHMKKLGLGWFECHGRQFRLREESPKMKAFLPPSGTSSPSTISLSELLANAGITEEWETDHFGKVARAREKIRIYPFVGDMQAPLARACS